MGKGQGLRVSPTTLALKEDATHPDHAKDIRVRLQSAPVGGSVTVKASESAGLAGKVSFSAALTFTSTNWNVEQSITVTALADADARMNRVWWSCQRVAPTMVGRKRVWR